MIASLMSKPKYIRVMRNLEPKQVAALKSLAVESGLSESAMLRKIINYYIGFGKGGAVEVLSSAE